MITIRKYTEEDKEQIWKIINSVISGDDSYVFAPDSPKEKMLACWCGADKKTYVAISENKIVGSFCIIFSNLNRTSKQRSKKKC